MNGPVGKSIMPRGRHLVRVAQEALCITSGMGRISFPGGSQCNSDNGQLFANGFWVQLRIEVACMFIKIMCVREHVVVCLLRFFFKKYTLFFNYPPGCVALGRAGGVSFLPPTTPPALSPAELFSA